MKKSLVLIIGIVFNVTLLGCANSFIDSTTIMHDGYDLTACKPQPDNYQVNVTLERDPYSPKVRRVINFNAENVLDATPYAIGYGTLDNYLKIDIGDFVGEVTPQSGNRVSVSLDYYEPTIWQGDDYMGIRVFDKNDCYNVDVTPFVDTQWIVVMLPMNKAHFHGSILTVEQPTFENCPMCTDLQTLEPATIIYTHSWQATAELLATGHVKGLIIDNDDGELVYPKGKSVWMLVDKTELSELSQQHEIQVAGINVPFNEFGETFAFAFEPTEPTVEDVLRHNPDVDPSILTDYFIVRFGDDSNGSSSGVSGWVTNPDRSNDYMDFVPWFGRNIFVEPG